MIERRVATVRSGVDEIDIDVLVNQLKQRVAKRRLEGDYPVGLEAQLEAEFDLIMAAVHRHEATTAGLGRRVSAVEEATSAVHGSAPTSSRLPGGSTIHAATQRLVHRQTEGLAASVRQLGTAISAALHEVHHMIDVTRSADERQLHQVVAALFDRIAVLDHVADAVVQLEARVAALEARPTRS
jgi:hypothetical protein